MTEIRQLRTILFADVAGYTALMRSDETSALSALETFKRIIENAAPVHSGEIIQYFGDGCLMSFESSTAALQFALDAQGAFHARELIPVRIGIHLGEVLFKHGNVFGDGVNLASRVESLGVPGSVLISKAVRDQVRNKDGYALKSLGEFAFKNVDEPVEVFALTNPPLYVPERAEMQGKTSKPSRRVVILNYFQRPLARAFVNILLYVVVASLGIELFAWFVAVTDRDPELVNFAVILATFGTASALAYTLFRGRWNWRALVVHVAVIFFAVAAMWEYLVNPSDYDPDTLRLFRSEKAERSPLSDLQSLAVLPFTNLTGNTEQDYLLAGMQDGLISELGHLGGIRTISRTSTLPYVDSGLRLQQIARELGVQAVIEGTLAGVDSVVQLRLKLINVFPDERQLWSRSFETSFRELPNFYSEVTRNVASRLDYAISPEEGQSLSANILVNPEAYRLYLKGSEYVGMLSDEGYERAEELYRRAIDLDPDFAAPYSGLATIWLSKRQKFQVRPDSANVIIDALLAKALRIDDQDAETWMAVGAQEYLSYRWTSAVEAFERSISLNPNFPGSHNLYSHALMCMGRWDEAWEESRIAEALAPNSPWVIGFSAVLYANSGKALSAAKRFDKLAKIAPDNPMANYSQLIKNVMLQRYDMALQNLKWRVAYIGLEELHPTMDSVYQVSGWETTVEATVAALEQRRDTMFISPGYMSRFYGQLMPDREKFIACMEEMYEIGDPDLPYLGIRGASPFQDDPRYIRVMEDIGLW